MSDGQVSGSVADAHAPGGRARILGDSDHRILLRLGDAVSAAGAVAGALVIWSLVQTAPFSLGYVADHAVWFVLVVPWMLLLLPAHRPGTMFSLRATATVAARAVVIGAMLYFAVFFLAPRSLLPRLVVLYFLGLAFLLTLAWHFLYVQAFTRALRRTPVAVVGTGPGARLIMDVLQNVMPHKHVIASVSESCPSPGGDAGLPAVIGVQDLERLVAERQVSELVLAHDGMFSPEVIRAVVSAQEQNVDVFRMQTVYENLLHRVPIRHLGPDVVLASGGDASGDLFLLAKRTADIAAGVVGCAVCLLLLPVLGPAVWFDLGSPILYRQQRVGRAGRRFELLKFRTMGHDAERAGPQWARPGDPRVSRFGRFLRRFCLDELPQFWNVLKGEMSLVGPRPERPEFVDELSRAIPFYRERLVVRPGLTGWAQVNHPYGRSLEDAATKLEYDLYYVKHRSLLFDLRIALRTAGAILAFRNR